MLSRSMQLLLVNLYRRVKTIECSSSGICESPANDRSKYRHSDNFGSSEAIRSDILMDIVITSEGPRIKCID